LLQPARDVFLALGIELTFQVAIRIGAAG